MKNKMTRLALSLIVIFMSCEDVENKNFEENSGEGETFIYDNESYNIQTDHSDIDKVYKLGIKAVNNNDTSLYDKVIRQYKLSPFPNRGISIVELMLIRNGYSKAYYDKVVLYGYKSEKYYSKKTEEKLIEYLRQAKIEGYKWKRINIFGKPVLYEDIEIVSR